LKTRKQAITNQGRSAILFSLITINWNAKSTQLKIPKLENLLRIMSKTPMQRHTTSMISALLISSRLSVKVKMSATQRISLIKCSFGMVLVWQTLSVFFLRVSVSHLLKHQWLVICSEKVFTLLICAVNQLITASLRSSIQQVLCFFVRLPSVNTLISIMLTTTQLIFLLVRAVLEVEVRLHLLRVPMWQFTMMLKCHLEKEQIRSSQVDREAPYCTMSSLCMISSRSRWSIFSDSNSFTNFE